MESIRINVRLGKGKYGKPEILCVITEPGYMSKFGKVIDGKRNTSSYMMEIFSIQKPFGKDNPTFSSESIKKRRRKK